MPRAFAAVLALVVAQTAACSSSESPPGNVVDSDAGSEGPPGWQVALDGEDLDRAVLSVWGTGANDVYAVGGPLGNDGYVALAIHFDGTAWTDLAPSGTDSFWWVAGTPANPADTTADVWMVGENGRVTHWDGSLFVEHDSGTTATLWGVWAASATDAWAVGGTPEGTADDPNDVVLHWDGSTWAPHLLPGEPLGRTLYKVWGTSSDNLYVVGEYGTIWHKRGSTWSLESDPPIAQGTLLTVHGCSDDEVYAVGGSDVLLYDGAAWTKQEIALSNAVNGVACGPSGSAAIVGFGGLKQRLHDHEWIDEFALPPYEDLHSTWTDVDGSVWVAGGNFTTKPTPMAPRKGIVARYGVGTISDAL